MSDEKREFIVYTPDAETAQSILEDLTQSGSSSPESVPVREVEIADAREINPTSTNYLLTKEEARLLKQDPRVGEVLDTVEVKPFKRAFQTGNFPKTVGSTGDKGNWGLIRHIAETNVFGTFDTDPGKTYDYVLDGTGVDVVIVDSGIQPDHPEFLVEGTAEYVSTAVKGDSTNGAVFDRSLTVHGLKIVVAGAVGGQLAVPTAWAEKTGKVVQLLTDPTDANINLTHQKRLVATLKGDAGTYHAGLPAAQRVAYGGGDSYDPNFLSDLGAPQYAGYVDFLDSHAVNDMVWYKNTSGPDPSTSDRDIEEIMEHLFHTIHIFGIQGAVPGSDTAVVMDPDRRFDLDNSFDWTQTELHLAMKEAITAGKFDPSGYSTTYDTDPGAAAVAYKEYTYLLNWGMWDMSQFWEGGSLSPEWADDMRTPEGIATNNPLGHALFVKYFQPVLSKPNFTTLQSIFQDNDAGASQYTPSTQGASRVQQINWFTSSGVFGTQPNGFYADYDGHGTHVASVVAGKTFGWAKNAHIFAIKLSSLAGPTDPFPGLSVNQAMDVLAGWHQAKAGSRPTVVINSWGYSIFWDTTQDAFTFDPTGAGAYYSVNGGDYRGTLWAGAIKDIAKGHTGGDYDTNIYQFPYPSASLDADIAILTAAGMVVVNAAGNDSVKADALGGADYNNYITLEGLENFYYHRGGSPNVKTLPGFQVGALGTTTVGAADPTEFKAFYSNAGPGVNIYAAGTYIMGAMSDTNIYPTAEPYNLDASHLQYSATGTSFAAPQAAGLAALLLQVHPTWRPAEVVNWIVGQTKAVMYDSGLDDDYSAVNSIWGGSNNLAYTPFGVRKTYGISTG